jgi:hypothetical protein
MPREKPDPARLREERSELDPLMRVLGGPAGLPPQQVLTQAVPTVGGAPTVALDTIAAELVRRFSFAGRGGSGTVRLEFGGGALAGGSLVISCEGRTLSVSLDAPGDPEAGALGEKIRQRLLARGLDVAEFAVNS